MNNKSNHQHNCQLHSSSMTAAQSLDEMDFERGIWSAGKYFIDSFFIKYVVWAYN